MKAIKAGKTYNIGKHFTGWVCFAVTPKDASFAFRETGSIGKLIGCLTVSRRQWYSIEEVRS
jgi:hypothetical protein